MSKSIFSAMPQGIDAQVVEVQVHAEPARGFDFMLLGHSELGTRSMRKRLQTALKSTPILLPSKYMVVNLAPLDMRKHGSGFDLAIAVALLTADGELKMSPQFRRETLFVGELALDGTVRNPKGTLPIALNARDMGFKRLVISVDSVDEVMFITNVEIIPVRSLEHLIEYIKGTISITMPHRDFKAQLEAVHHLDFAEVKGQQQAKRALQIAAAGRHHCLFIGSPGSGKTMLAQRLSSIMPPMSFDEIIETSKIYSVAGMLKDGKLVSQRPFRSPHHTVPAASLIGGGINPAPGEISFAHNGVLFLDELTEYKRPIIENLRQPLEERLVHISRLQQTITYPSSFVLIAATNPCPCGYYGDPKKACICSAGTVQSYFGRLSGPLLDRIDIQVRLHSVEYSMIKDQSIQVSSADLKKPIKRAIELQAKRNVFNGLMGAAQVEQFCLLEPAAEAVIKMAFDRLNLSMRSYHKILKLSRTIADLSDSDMISVAHIKEALAYRLNQ